MAVTLVYTIFLAVLCVVHTSDLACRSEAEKCHKEDINEGKFYSYSDKIILMMLPVKEVY